MKSYSEMEIWVLMNPVSPLPQMMIYDTSKDSEKGLITRSRFSETNDTLDIDSSRDKSKICTSVVVKIISDKEKCAKYYNPSCGLSVPPVSFAGLYH